MGTAVFQKLRQTKQRIGDEKRWRERERDEQSVRVFVHTPEWVKVHSLGQIKSVQRGGRWNKRTKYPVKRVSGRKIIVASVSRFLK